MCKRTDPTTVDGRLTKEEVFEYLEDLRKSGVTNMFGAGSYVENEFFLTKTEARELLIEWMKSK